jgi:uncharacterized protein YecE (DUF72 family)
MRSAPAPRRLLRFGVGESTIPRRELIERGFVRCRGRPLSGARQLDLFGGPPSPVRERPTSAARQPPIGGARVDPQLARLAERLPPQIRLGTSSWSFPGWAGIVWDRPTSAERLAREGLAAYARHPLLRTVGIDRTFYAPLAAEDFARYASVVPAGFRFLVKAAAECTTPVIRREDGRSGGMNPHYLDPHFATTEVVQPFVEGLGSMAGPLVFQFPPAAVDERPARFAERVGRFLAALPRGPLYAVELREQRLLGPDYFLALEDAQARHCVNVHPRMPPPDEQLALAEGTAHGPLVVRWMLGGRLGYEQARERYAPFDRLRDADQVTRRTLARLAVEHAAEGHEVFVVANNKAEGSAPLTLFALAEAVAAALVPRA